MTNRELTVDLFATVEGSALGTRSAAYFGCQGPELDAWVAEQSAQPQVVLMGRVTYEVLAAHTPPPSDTQSDPLTATSKIVFSSTLDRVSWANTRLVTTDLGTAVTTLKAETGPPIRTLGSLSLVASLLHLGLVDRVRLMVFPQILGDTGREPIFDRAPDVNLRLADTTVLDQRLVLLEYLVTP